LSRAILVCVVETRWKRLLSHHGSKEIDSGMEYRDMRELVRIRHELRSLAHTGDRDTAATLLARMRLLAAGDAAEEAAVQPEVRRWQFVFGLSVFEPDGAR
jgi:hypothetical protein